MSINHLINPSIPYTTDEGLLSLKVGYLTCDGLTNLGITAGKNLGATTIDNISDPNITVSNGSFHYEKGSGVFPANNYLTNFTITISAPVASHKLSFDLTNAVMSFVGNFDAVIMGTMANDTGGVPALVVQRVVNVSTNTVNLSFQTADGSNLVAGSWYGYIKWSI